MADQGHTVDPLDAAFNAGDGGTAPTGGQGQPDATTTPSAVQPEGQGQPDAQSGLYDLTTVPEEYRSHVERIAKDIDRNVNAKLQEAAEFRKNFEPYQQIGLHEYDPEGVDALLQFASKLADEDKTIATQAILDLAQSLELDLGQTPAAPADGDDPNLPLTRAEFEQWQQAQDQARQEAVLEQQYQAEALVAYKAEYAAAEKANGKPFSEDEKAQLLQLAKRFQGHEEQPITAAFEFINSIAGKAETALVKGQPTPPAPAEPAGRASTAIQPVDTFEEAERLHRARNASAHA